VVAVNAGARASCGRPFEGGWVDAVARASCRRRRRQGCRGRQCAAQSWSECCTVSVRAVRAACETTACARAKKRTARADLRMALHVPRLVQHSLLRSRGAYPNTRAARAQDFLERRLQTLVFKLGLAKSIHHARVLIRQRHIRVGKQIVNVPSFLVRVDSQKHIDFALNSPFGGGRPGRNKRKAQKAKKGGGDGDGDAEEEEEE